MRPAPRATALATSCILSVLSASTPFAQPAATVRQASTINGTAADDPAGGTRMLRTPSVSATHIAFAYAGNIWIVPRSGGDAKRLTTFPGEAGNPQLSPDGNTVAFSGQYAGNVDVYVVPSRGGEPKRLTWHPAADQVQGWTPDGRTIVFASGRATAAPSPAPRFWTIPVAGGIEQPMAIPRANQGKISPDGKYLAYRMPTSWDEHRRNYKGGQNKPIWIVDLKTHDLITPPWKDSKEMDPVWVGGTIYFLSDRDGVSNVWKFDPASRQLAQVTKFTDFDVKALGSDGRSTVVFEQGGWIHQLDAASGRAAKVNIVATGDFPWMMPQWKDVANRMTNLALSSTGRRAAVEARGEIFTIPAAQGDVRNLTNSSGSAERAPAWSPDGRSVAYFSDRSGEYRLYIAPQDGLAAPREIRIPEAANFFAPAWSPDGRKLSFQDTHFRLWVVDVATGAAKIADADKVYHGDRTIVPAWSPDSRYLAYPKHLPSLFRALYIHDVATGQSRQVTDGLADVVSPAWDASGKYLWFLASTDYGLNSSVLDMSAYEKGVTRGLYLTVLAKADSSPLRPESDEETGRGARGAGREGQPDSTRAPSSASASASAAPSAVSDSARARQRPVTVTIDWDGLQDRTIAVQSIAPRGYAQLRPGVAGTVFFGEPLPATGTGAQGAGGAVLHRYQLSTRKAVEFARGVAQYVVSADGRKLLYRSAGGGGAGGGDGAGAQQAPQLFLVDAAGAVPQPATGRLAVQLRAYVDPKAEFKQIFDEGWRNQKYNFYVQNLHGTDWNAVRKMYEPMLEHVRHRADLNYLLDNMGAELAIGHSYVRGGEMPDVPESRAGLLGADFSVDQGRYRIDRIYTSETWNPELRAPLAEPGVNVSVGDYVVAVNGVELRAPDNIYRLLDGTANRQVVIAVNSRPSMDGARNVTVVPVANEQGLRTRAWVERNRRLVDSLSNGQLAYVYVPNTGQPGYTSFNRYYFAQQDRKGVVVDERFNGGGSAADYMVDILGRKFDGYFNNPAGDRVPFTSPATGIWGPKVMIINEMAGSGGDLLPFMFKQRKLGPLVGTRTWGGLVATSDTPPFVDGGSMIAPRFGFIDAEGNFAVENVGVAPDVEVENYPKEVIAGRDPQLERAVQEALRLLRENPPVRIMKEPTPPTWGKRP